ncbi:MAG: Tethering factor for nuclear proteasome sts1 [Sclerophora amabilis]|nr:MAG: Tethering factor for nuclear proteasome sts1 [Sclerophora amabilis]
MNSLQTPPLFPPHLHGSTLFPPARSLPGHYTAMNGRKRKHDDETDDVPYERRSSRESSSPGDADDRMSASPSNSTFLPPLPRPVPTRTKRIRTNVSGRPLALPRLLETLDAAAMRNLLHSICDRHPEIGTEVVHSAPRPSVESALSVLRTYETNLETAFPFGGNRSSDYAYNRVRQALKDLLDSLGDYTPHFLPPNETHTTTSLLFLDGATDIIHRLPVWDNNTHNHHKSIAYEEISKAWALVIKEAAKRAAGIQLANGGWDQKLAKHNEQAEGRMKAALDELSSRLGWMGGHGSTASDDGGSIRQQLLSGTYGTNLPARVGPW